MAHLCNQPFGRFSAELHWWSGSPWRSHREYVGRIAYGVRWLMWSPELHPQLPPNFRAMVWQLMLSRHPRADQSALSRLQPELLLFVLNKVEWWEMGDKSAPDWQPPAALTRREPRPNVDRPYYYHQVVPRVTTPPPPLLLLTPGCSSPHCALRKRVAPPGWCVVDHLVNHTPYTSRCTSRIA